MARLSKSQLLDAVLEGCHDAGWRALLVERHHPFLIRLYNDEESYSVRVYVWNLTHGGGRARPADEYRIQVTGIDTGIGFIASGAEKILVLGWWDDAEVFAGFDVTKHTGSLGSSPSIQIREEALRLATIRGIATHDKGNDEIAVAFKPNLLPAYVRDLERLHGLGDSPTAREALESVAEDPDTQPAGKLAGVPPDRQTVIITIAKKLRDSSFKDRVLSAYGNSCAFCNLQLKLIDAAHILPVAEQGTDFTSNGLALCALHHRAYDRAFVTVNESYQIIVNERKLEEFQAVGLDGGYDAFQAALRPVIRVPPTKNDRPDAASIQTANQLRGWTAA